MTTISTTEKSSKSSNIFNCENCDYTTSRYSQYTRHLSTSKHINNNVSTIKNVQKVPPKIYVCSYCDNTYNDRAGLWRHKKKCKQEKENCDDELLNNSNLILEMLKEKSLPTENNESLIIELLKQNQDFKNLMIEQNKYMMEQSKQMMELAKNAGNNTNCNNTNNKFNMQIFLNETCKDAMSITEFVNSLVLTFKDLEDLGRYGYTQGITNIFTRGLQATEVSKRPIHCSDMKRLIIYINDTNGWEKDNSSQEKVIQLIKKIAGKNLRQATEWMRINHSMIHGPDSHEQRQYLKMISQWFGGTDEENVKIYNKIIRNIAPQCYIDKYPALK